MSNIWQVRTPSRRVISSEQALKKELLRQRGVDPGTVTSFFHPLYERDIHNPLLLADMQIAVDRIYQAINKGQRIIIYGDYDADGISSTAIITSTLLKLGAKVTPYLPHRTQEGYGLNAEVLKSITPEMDLLITMDCGITHYREIQALNIKGIDSIIVDHHTVPKKLPPAAAIVHPNLPNSNYPSKNLCAAGLAWKLSAALLAQHTASDEDDEKWLLDLAMLGTVADMVPLIGENRAITIFGLEVLRRTPRPGLRALVAQATRESQPLTATDIAFRVIPKINAAGRMDHPQPALELLLTTNEDRAQELAAQITSYNNQRQTVSKKILLEAENQADLEAPVLFAYNANWHAGVIGLVAGRLSDRFNRPAIVLAGNGTNAIGSARAPLGQNILSILTKGSTHLSKFGGHNQAAGFTLEKNKVAAFKEALSVEVKDKQPVDLLNQVTADAVVSSHLVSRPTADMIASLAPFGEGNPEPSFIIRNVPLMNWRPVGKTKNHAKCTFWINGQAVDGIGFGLAEKLITESSLKGTPTTIYGRIEENEFRGRKSLQLTIMDIAADDKVKIQSL